MIPQPLHEQLNRIFAVSQQLMQIYIRDQKVCIIQYTTYPWYSKSAWTAGRKGSPWFNMGDTLLWKPAHQEVRL